MSWIDALELRKDEKVIDSWQGIREIIGETFEVTLDKDKKKRKVQTKERKEGLLVLTNQRLLFLEGQEPDGSKLGEALHLSLIDVGKVWFEKAPLEPIEKINGFETHIFTLKHVGKKKDFNRFKDLLDEYCKKRKEELAVEARKGIRFRIG